MIRAALIGPDGRVELGGAELADRKIPEGGTLWIDLQGRTRDSERLLMSWGYHPLAVEDTFTLEHQPKFETYDKYLFTIVRGVDFSRVRHRLDTLKLAAFLDDRRLVTYHRAPLGSVDRVFQKLGESGRAPAGGVSHLFYGICDELIDNYFPVVEEMASKIEELERQIFADPDQDQLEEILELRRRLAGLRQVLVPHRFIFNHLASARTPYVDEHEALYFRDIYDNVLRLTDLVDQQREQLLSSKDTYLSAISQRTNEVMKVLTLFSAVLLPLSFIASLYGMNFRNMPELATRWGYYAVLGVMALIGGGMLGWFRHKRWL
jgi:magnesium transporter